MNTKKIIFNVMMAVGAIFLVASCSDNKSYADLLNEESKYVNAFLADQRVEGSIPADTVFETGPDAPYYQLDEEGNIFMQVIDPGFGEKAEKGERVYFRFTRYLLSTYVSGKEMAGDGNESDMSQMDTYFDYQTTDLPSAMQYGSGLQMPLEYLPLNCEVKLVIKSQYGFSSDVSLVKPYLYHVRYYKSQV